MTPVLLFPHGGSGNHGCEAIVRSTTKIIGSETFLVSSSPEEDSCYGLEDCCQIIKDRTTLRRWSLSHLKALVQFRVLQDQDAFDKLVFRPIFDIAEKCDWALSIGGDNYCYGEQKHLYLINRELRKRNINTALWGCSIEPDTIHGALLEELQGYLWISARESISFDALKAKGLQRVYLFPDPAFALEKKVTALPEGFVKDNTVGINISPMIFSYGKSKEIIIANYIYLIERILRETDMAIALIPHVVWSHNDDRKPLGLLWDRFKESGRVIMIEDRPAEELKFIIARCRFVIAARTHASIAAYSECIPTLAVGYSVKARGIARDVFGSEGRFVCPVQSMIRPDRLWSDFQWIMTHEASIRIRYQEVMADYIGKAKAAGRLVY